MAKKPSGAAFRKRRRARARTAGRVLTDDVKTLCRALVQDPVYLARLQDRLLRGTAGAMEVLLHHYAYGKPREQVQVAHAGALQVIWAGELERGAALAPEGAPPALPPSTAPGAAPPDVTGQATAQAVLASVAQAREAGLTLKQAPPDPETRQKRAVQRAAQQAAEAWGLDVVEHMAAIAKFMEDTATVEETWGDTLTPSAPPSEEEPV